MDETRQLLAVVNSLYDAVADLSKWPVFLEGVSKLFKARGAQIGHWDLVNSQHSFSIVHGYDWSGEHTKRYESLMGEDPRLPYFSANPFKPIHCRMSLTDEQLRQSRVYKEVLSVGEVEYSLGVNLVEDTHALTYFLLLRDRSQPPFDDSDCELLSALIPHLTRALKLQRDLGSIEFGKNVGFDTLDCMALGIIVINADARVMFCNQAAREVSDANDGVRIAGGRLMIEGPDGDRLQLRAQRIIDCALSGIPSAGDAFHVDRPSGAEAYSVLLSALWGNQLRFGWSMLNEPLAIIYVRDPGRPEEARSETLQRLYRLTPSQSRLAELLATGCSLEQGAKQLGITLSSARQYLKLIFQKTGTSRQAELVRKIMLVPPLPRSRACGQLPQSPNALKADKSESAA